eukprot:scaffold2663_cov256-Pinguiococcus_pyrenoidosus.AAC.7
MEQRQHARVQILAAEVVEGAAHGLLQSARSASDIEVHHVRGEFRQRQLVKQADLPICLDEVHHCGGAIERELSGLCPQKRETRILHQRGRRLIYGTKRRSALPRAESAASRVLQALL